MGTRSTILRNLASARFRTSVVDKALARASDLRRRGERSEMQRWCAERAITAEAYMKSQPELAREADRYAAALSERGLREVRGSGIGPGTAGHTALLYFLVRTHRPGLVVETGVAAGFSSAAILAAMNANGFGSLWSSDLPYVRRDHPERLVGMLVPPEHRDDWHLYIDGDRVNLRRIASQINRIDMIHYDSDKSWRGRQRALRILRPLLAPNAVVVFDDVEDNGHFRAYAGDSATVIRGPRSYVGILELTT